MFHIAPFTARSNRTLLRVALFLLGWRTLSLDLGALPFFIEGKSLFLGELQRTLFHQENTILLGQLFVAAVMLFALLNPTRGRLIAAALAGAFFEGVLFQFRPSLGEIEIAVGVLAFACCFPSAAYAKHPRITPPSIRLGVLFFLYLCSFYFLAALGKLNQPAWWSRLHLENIAEAGLYWIGQPRPGAFFFAPLFERPGVSAAVGMGIVLGQLTLPAALWFRPWRAILVTFLLVFHGGIFWTTGICFLTLPILMISSLLAIELPHKCPVPAAFLIPTATALIAIPLLFPWDNPFVSDRFFRLHFTLEPPRTIYRLGYRHQSGAIRVFPFHQGGFLDYHLPLQINKAMPDKADSNLPWLHGIRPYQSNRWLLGYFACPDHIQVPSAPYLPAYPLEFFQLRALRQKDKIRWQVEEPLSLS